MKNADLLCRVTKAAGSSFLVTRLPRPIIDSSLHRAEDGKSDETAVTQGCAKRILQPGITPASVYKPSASSSLHSLFNHNLLFIPDSHRTKTPDIFIQESKMAPSAMPETLRNGDAKIDEKSDMKPGMIGDIRNLYQSKPDDCGKTTWVETYPDDLTKAAENAESAKYALLIRNKKCYNGRKSLEIDSIVIQSPLLKKSLGQVLKGYPGVTTGLDRLTFSAPFKPFVHRWKNLVHVLEQESDAEAKSHLSLLHRVLEQELHDDLKALDDYILNGVITFNTCWMLFEPGVLVFGSKSGQAAVAKLKDGSYRETRCGNIFHLPCTMVDWDGENFGLATANFAIGEFGGTAKITQLSAHPLSYHPRLEKIKADLIQRGKAFEALSGYHYKHYQGTAVGQGPWGPIKYNVSSMFAKLSSSTHLYTAG